MRCTIVIVNYDTEEHLAGCLESLERHLAERPPVVVVDNSPAPATASVVARFTGVEVLRPGRNLGFAGGANLGLRRALDEGAEHALLLNPDTLAEEDFLAPLVTIMDAEASVAAASPRILHLDEGRDPYFAGARMSWWTGGPRHVVDDRFAGQPWRPMPFLSGCAMLLRGSAVREIGGLDERYFLYFEDADYVRRLLAAGYQAAYVPGATLRHAVSASIDRRGRRHTYHYARSRMLFMRRWAAGHHLAAFLLFTALIKAPGALLLFGLARRRPGQALAFLRGTLDGWRALDPSPPEPTFDR